MNRIVIKDDTTQKEFLIDTGADISVLPAKKGAPKVPHSMKLYAANGSIINTYGQSTLKLDLGLRRAFNWTFTIADVQQSIIGNDFLAHFDLLVDVKKRALIDKTTSLKSPGVRKSTGLSMLKTFNIYSVQ